MRPIELIPTRILLLLGLSVFCGTLGMAPCRSQGAVEVVPQIGHGDFTYRAVYSPNGRLIASGSNDGTVKIWDASTGTLLRTLRGRRKGISSIAFLHDGSRVLTGSYDHTIRLWNVSTGGVDKTFETPQGVRSIALAPNGKTFAFGNLAGTISILNLMTGAIVRNIPAYNPEYKGWTMVVYTPDGRFLVSANTVDLGLKVWDARNGTLIRTLESGSAAALALSRNGQLAAIGNFDKISIWRVFIGIESCCRHFHFDGWRPH